jgi:hypothetical protein
MRTIVSIGAIAAIASIAFVVLRREDGSKRRPEPIPEQETETANNQELKNTVVSALLRQQQLGNEQPQGNVNGRIAELEARLRSVETAGKKVENTTESKSGTKSATRISDARLGLWMDDALRRQWDRDGSNQARAQVEKGLAQVPGANLEELDCSKRFCRALFAQDNGERPVRGQLIGLLPFTNEGFTVDDPDGRVAIYFTRSGESLDELRKEATASVR